MPDIRLPVGSTMFALRAGILCLQKSQLLAISGAGFSFKYLPGGAVAVNESAAEAASREWLEETGLAAAPVRLVGVVENFFELKGQAWHEIGFYFVMDAPDGLTRQPSTLLDQHDQIMHWIAVTELEHERVYPACIPELLNVPVGEIRHILNREDTTSSTKDLRVKVADTEVQIRVHLLYTQNGKLLTNTVPDSGIWFLPGGSVKVGEDSLAAALREWHEETGVPANHCRLVAVMEGFDPAVSRQQLGFFYLVCPATPLPETLFPVMDDDQLVLDWVPVAEIESRPVHPQWISTLLNVPAGQIQHFIQRWS